MKNDIDLFIERIKAHVNNHIAGTGNTKIERCNCLTEKLPRGRAIQMDIIVPETIMLEEGEHMGPVYYVEELMKEFPNSTPEAVAEVLNIRVNEMYETFMELAHMQKDKLRQTVNDYDPKDIILSAILRWSSIFVTLPLNKFHCFVYLFSNGVIYPFDE